MSRRDGDLGLKKRKKEAVLDKRSASVPKICNEMLSLFLDYGSRKSSFNFFSVILDIVTIY